MDILKSIGIDKDKLSFPYLLKENRNLYRDINKLIKENEKLSDSEYRWMETSGYMEHLYNESKSENELLKDENARLNDMCFRLTQENSVNDKHIEELEDNLKEYYKIQDRQQEQLEDSMLYGEDNPYYLEKYHPKLFQEILKNKSLENRVEQLESELEIKERLDTDKPLDEDYYHTKELDYGLLSKTIDKITDERNTYKEVINIMCDKFDIPHDSVLNIIDDISQNKGVEIERV